MATKNADGTLTFKDKAEAAAYAVGAGLDPMVARIVTEAPGRGVGVSDMARIMGTRGQLLRRKLRGDTPGMDAALVAAYLNRGDANRELILDTLNSGALAVLHKIALGMGSRVGLDGTGRSGGNAAGTALIDAARAEASAQHAAWEAAQKALQDANKPPQNGPASK